MFFLSSALLTELLYTFITFNTLAVYAFDFDVYILLSTPHILYLINWVSARGETPHITSVEWQGHV